MLQRAHAAPSHPQGVVQVVMRPLVARCSPVISRRLLWVVEMNRWAQEESRLSRQQADLRAQQVDYQCRRPYPKSRPPWVAWPAPKMEDLQEQARPHPQYGWLFVVEGHLPFLVHAKAN